MLPAPDVASADDVAALPAGSETELGERGINLSGALCCAVLCCAVLYACWLRLDVPVRPRCCMLFGTPKRCDVGPRWMQAARRRGWRWPEPPTHKPTSRWEVCLQHASSQDVRHS